LRILENIRQKKRGEESGIGLAEVMVAIIVIAILLIASASAFTGAISANVASGNRNQAIQISQDIISVAKQAPFNRVAVVVPEGTNAAPSQCSDAWTGTYNGLNIITQTTKYPGLVYCQISKIPSTGMVYAAYTYITPVTLNNYDSTSKVVNVSRFVPRRITVEVVWFDQITSGGAVTYQSVTQSYIRTPNINECIPASNYASGSPTPPGCS
jgi:type II secretory pathway pseudopilin PulG